MDWLHKLLARVTTQLWGLSLSQRLAIMLGGVLVAVSVIGLVRWAATPEMVPLLDQDLAAEDLARVRGGLERLREPFQLVGQKLMVRADTSRTAILAQLQQQDQLPADTSVGFDALVKESNPWISQAEHERRWAVALKNEVEKVLRQFEGVKSASVFLPLTAANRGFARNAPAATASVTLIMHGGRAVPHELALAAARLVAGAVRGLPLKNVEVLDGNGVSALDWESESAGITALDRKRRAEEQAIQKKIANQLADPRVLVSVQAEIEVANQNTETETPSKPVETSVETTNEETSRMRDGGQPGVQPNVGVAAGGRAADERTVKSTEKTESKVGMTREVKSIPPGAVKEVWAAVRISRSYLESIFRRANPGSATPTEAQIEELFEREKPRVISQVTKLVKPQDEDHVDVGWYYDAVVEAADPETHASTLDDAFHIARQYGPQSGLALLALAALGLMLRMARRSDGAEAFGVEIGLPKEAVEAAQQASQHVAQVTQTRGPRPRAAQVDADSSGIEEVLEVDAAAIGQAAVTEGILVAQEVDEKTVQTHKMLQQVAQVIERDPDAASTLLEQWVQRTDAYP